MEMTLKKLSRLLYKEFQRKNSKNITKLNLSIQLSSFWLKYAELMENWGKEVFQR